ncbi:MAG: hypothetical protein R2695_06505 [Acidimicrobiales bacterium]
MQRWPAHPRSAARGNGDRRRRLRGDGLTSTPAPAAPGVPASAARAHLTGDDGPPARSHAGRGRGRSNVLHGLAPPISGCAVETDQCHVAARLQILWTTSRTTSAAPDIVALQEIAGRWFEVVPERLGDLCDGTYVLLTENLDLPDQEMILTTLPVIDDGRIGAGRRPPGGRRTGQLGAGDGSRSTSRRNALRQLVVQSALQPSLA